MVFHSTVLCQGYLWAGFMRRPEISAPQNSIHGRNVKEYKTVKGTHTLDFDGLSLFPNMKLQALLNRWFYHFLTCGASGKK